MQQAIWLFYLRFTLSLRNVEDLLAERGIAVSYETIRRWVNRFGPIIAADLRKRRLKPDAVWHLDEVYLKIAGRRPEASAGEAGALDRLALSGGAVRRCLFGWIGPSARADSAYGGSGDPQAYARSVRRGSVRALD
jgi:hypothetical protein